MMKLIKILAAISVVVLLLFIFVFNFSSVESRFQCRGEISSKDGSRPVTGFVKLVKYRWWVGLWSESDAAMHFEIPKTYVDYFGNVKKAGDQYQIFDSEKRLKGNYSTLSNALAIKLHIGFFEGTCKRID
ncbi:MAG: hypothetical protein K4571_06160 [Deltaproteobacteria bacterium]